MNYLLENSVNTERESADHFVKRSTQFDDFFFFFFFFVGRRQSLFHRTKLKQSAKGGEGPRCISGFLVES